jgi:DNA (cytosine-5)-methyltransferase 1
MSDQSRMTVGSLFSGIGGLELGLERAGMRTVWQVEKDDYARRVLAKHWPTVRRWDDVKTFPPDDGHDWGCDLICGGFPCQDISFAGAGAGIHGERSSLWFEFARVVRVVRPRYVLVENVPALLHRGMGDVLGTLAALGYDAEWDCLQASGFGAFHNRERVFICAYRPGSVQGVFTEARGEWQREIKSRRLASSQASSRWPAERFDSEPDVAVLVDGGPDWLGRLGAGRAYGNAVVPAVSEWLGRRILSAEG